LCNRTRIEYFAYLKQTAAVIAVFDTNLSFHVSLAFRFFGFEFRNRRIYNTYFLTLKEYPHETETSLSLQFSSHIFTIIYKMNCFIYVISIATCNPKLFIITYVFIDSEVNFICSIYNNYKFSVAQKMLCTPVTSSRLSASAAIFLSVR
jgi:hypothetical protein